MKAWNEDVVQRHVKHVGLCICNLGIPKTAPIYEMLHIHADMTKLVSLDSHKLVERCNLLPPRVEASQTVNKHSIQFANSTYYNIFQEASSPE
jgi:hypothetical protein